MVPHKINIQNFLIFCLFAGLIFVLQPFLQDLVWGGICAILAYPLYCLILKKISKPNISAAIALFLFGSVALLPGIFTVNTLSAELKDLIVYLKNINSAGLPAPEYLKKIPFISQTIIDWWNVNLAHPGGLFSVFKGFAFTQNTANVLKQISTYLAADVLHFVVAGICAWVFLSQHQTIVSSIKKLIFQSMPDYAAMLIDRVPKMLKATAFGLGSVALLEGVVLGSAYFLAGAPFPILLAVMTAYLALIPGGAPFSFTFVAIILLAQGKGLNALLLFSWGAFELFMVDKFIRPKLIGNEVGLPFLAVLLSLIGGVASMGILGLFVGPVLMTCVFAILGLEKSSK